MTQSLLTEYVSITADLHEDVLRLQVFAEKITEHASRMRSMSDALQDFKSTLDTPGAVITLPRGIKPKGDEAA